MKPFLLRALVYILPLLACLALVEAALRSIPNDYSFKHDRLSKDGASFQFLVLGNSHAYKGVDPSQMSHPGFNAANISQDHSYDRALLEHHAHDLQNLKFVLLPVSYASIGARLETGKEAWRIKNYTLYMDLSERSTQLDHWLELMNRPMRDQMTMLRAWWEKGKDNRSCNDHGAGQQLRPKNFDLSSNASKAAARHRARSRERLDANRSELERIVAFASQRGIRVIIFMPPCTPAYREALDKAQLNMAIALAEELARENDRVEFHNFMDATGFVDADFGDADHLGPSGAAKLSQALDAFMSDHDHPGEHPQNVSDR